MAQLTSEELQSIKDLQSQYNQTIFEIGAAEAQLIVFHEQIEKLVEAKENIENSILYALQKEIRSIKKKIESR